MVIRRTIVRGEDDQAQVPQAPKERTRENEKQNNQKVKELVVPPMPKQSSKEQ